MSKLTITFKNERQIIRAFKDAPRELALLIQQAVAQTGGETVGKVKQVISSGTGMWKSPLDTGTMMRNVQIVEKSPLRVVISPSNTITPYAKFVHEGTSRMQARPFLEITKQTEEKNIQSFFHRTLEGFVRALARKIG